MLSIKNLNETLIKGKGLDKLILFRNKIKKIKKHIIGIELDNLILLKKKFKKIFI